MSRSSFLFEQTLMLVGNSIDGLHTSNIHNCIHNTISAIGTLHCTFYALLQFGMLFAEKRCGIHHQRDFTTYTLGYLITIYCMTGKIIRTIKNILAVIGKLKNNRILLLEYVHYFIHNRVIVKNRIVIFRHNSSTLCRQMRTRLKIILGLKP